MRITSKQDISKDVSLLWVLGEGELILGSEYVIDGIAFKIVRILEEADDEIELLVKIK